MVKTIKDLAKEVADSELQISARDAEVVIKQLVECIKKDVYVDKDDIYLHTFGSIKVKKAPARNVRHPGTGEMMMIPERDVYKFYPTKEVKDAYKKG